MNPTTRKPTYESLREQLDAMAARAENNEALARYWQACYRKAVSHDGRIIAHQQEAQPCE